jgi:8-oxo-dGTP pyrophosphatase MutT (NUDIX family)
MLWRMSKQNNPFKLISSQLIYQNPWIKVREDKVIRPGGKEGIFGVVTFSHGASVLPVDDNNIVTLVKEYKYGVGRLSIETVCGAVDDGETPIQAAKRELAEEANLTAGQWQDLGSINALTTIGEIENHMFLARKLTYSEGQPDEGEVIEKITVPYKEALRMVMDGEITHGASCVLILKARDYII